MWNLNMWKVKKALPTIGLLCAALLFVSCSSPSATPAATQAPSAGAAAPTKAPAAAAPTQASAAKPVLKIGGVWPSSGTGAPFGQRYANAVKIAVDEINASGKYPFTVQVIPADAGAGDPATAVNAASKVIVGDNVNVLFAPNGSSMVIGMQAIVNQYDIGAITPSAADRRAATESKGHIFMLLPDSLGVDKAFFKLLLDKMKPKAFFGVYINTDAGNSEMQQQKDVLTAAGVNIVGQVQVSAETPDFAPVVTRIKSSGADMVSATVFGAQQAQLAWALKEAGVKTQLVDPAYYDPNTWNNGKEAVDGMIVHAWFHPDAPKAQPFVKKYQDLYKVAPDMHAANAYDIIYVLADAASRAGSLDRAAIKTAIAATNIEGASGPIAFNPDGTRKTFNSVLMRFNAAKGQLEQMQ